ncbi:LCP family protein [Nocardioides sp. YIM 152315]|uniref:LCP family protein n=1 Tax=Nocardioides sp. YIM 152315 TaxID=3031760 RepID=UPI0023DBC60B|nr:LCP family protein [Nocardioides sp. YIM 152315]MDF1606371.1 LCP family protein [Nocardioides sp. YIM 152315]
MNDRPRSDGEPGDGTPDFHWLYGGDGSDQDQDRPGRREPRPDETRVMPTMPRPSEQQAAPHPPRERAGTPPTPPPLAPTPGGERPRRRRGPRFYLRIVLVLLLLWVVYLVAVPLWTWKSVESVEWEPKGDRPADQPGTTYLMVGSDSRAGLSAEQRKEFATGNPKSQLSDTIMILHTGSGPNLLVSLPRDSIVDIPGHGSTKINAAYSYGGPKLLVQTVEQNTGIRIDDYVEIGLGGVAGVVDAVGGIEICPTSDMTDKLAGLEIEKGCQEVDGKTALAYSRSRHTSATGDIDRVKHQREVVAAVGDKVISPWTFINPVRYWRLANAVPDFFAFGEGTGPVQAGKWALAMTNVDLSCVVPLASLEVRWDEERSQRMFDYIKEDDVADMPKGLCRANGGLS